MEFQKKGFQILKGAINKELLKIVSDYLIIQSKIGGFQYDGISKFAKYGDSLTESLLLFCQPIIEEHTGKKIFPTYSYARIYQKGDWLKPHLDRKSCEYSLTIPVSYRSRTVWPIYVLKKGKKMNIHLDIGDMLLYKGCEVVHGRDVFTGSRWIQIFLHYVDAEGENAVWKFDKRKQIGLRFVKK